MEGAGWQVARFCPNRTAVVCGVGNNAGDGLAAARHLHRWGKLASVSCIDRARLQGSAAKELIALRTIAVEITSGLRLDCAHAVIHALFATGLSRSAERTFASAIHA